MLPKTFEQLPAAMQREAVRPYFEALSKKRGALLLKRLADIVLSAVMLSVLFPVLLLLALAVVLDSRGGVFYRQVRVTTFGRQFRIFKFRSMVAEADKQGPLVTVGEDSRITRVGHFIRKTHLDELPQLIMVLLGDMSFVGTRPEVPKYVAHYTDEMYATLLLPAGITSHTSVKYHDEARLLESAEDADKTYTEVILPQKMQYNLEYVKDFTVFSDIKTIIETAKLFFGGK